MSLLGRVEIWLTSVTPSSQILLHSDLSPADWAWETFGGNYGRMVRNSAMVTIESL